MTAQPSDPTAMSVADASALASQVLDEVEKAVVGKRPSAHPGAVGRPGQGARAARGLPRPRQDAGGAEPGAVLGLDFARVQFTPDLLPADITGSFLYNQKEGTLRVPARAALHRPGARRRDQPDAPQDPVGAARGDAGAAGDRGGRDLPAARPLPRARDGQPDRVRRHLPAPRGPARPVPDAGQLRLPHRGRGVRRGAAPARAAARGGRPRSRSPTPPGSGRSRRRWRR